ncbi:MAG: PD-(D/E)XK nuclease family protein [Spirochaetia bacterium]|nr:PD-(D/E)XK nuclease family protein [Spirochaetia bacterium]
MNLTTTEAVRNAVFSSFDDFSTYSIFPNENIRRFWVEDYALKSEKGALLLHKVLAWDNFTSFFYETNDKKASDYTTKYLFAQQLLEHYQDQLSHFIQPNFPHLSSNLTSSIVSLLSNYPSIKRLEKEESEQYFSLPPSYRKDIDVIVREYISFLDERELYDSSFIEKHECKEKKLLTSKVVLFFPELCTSYAQYEELVENIPNITIYRVKTEKQVPLLVYDNERKEIASTIVKIKKLLLQGLSHDDIIITVGELKRLRRYIELEALSNQLPLTIVSGTSIFDYSVGAMFLSFKEVHQYHFDVEYVKKLLLSPTIPWKEKEIHRNLIKRGYELHIHQRSSYHQYNDWKKKLDTSNKEDKKLYDYAFRLFQIIDKMVTSRSASHISQSLLMLQNNYFIEGSFALDSTLVVQSVENQAYTFCLEQLKVLSNQISLCKLEIDSSLYSFFITLLQSKKFNPTGKHMGIRVYDWQHGVGLAPPYHFFINCSSQIIDSPSLHLPLLPSFSIEEGEKDALLGYYMASGEHLLYSYSPIGFSNTANLPASFFVSHSLLQKADTNESTLLTLEERAWEENMAPRKHLFSKSQIQGFTYACSTFFNEKKIDLAKNEISLPIALYVENEDNLIPLSSSSLEMFESCPFKYISAYLFKVKKEDFEEVILDHGEIGSLQHEILAQFFMRVENELGSFTPHQPSTMEQILREVIDEMVKKVTYVRGDVESHIVHYMRVHYFDSLLAIIDKEIELYGSNHTKAVELDLKYDEVERGYQLKGRIDRVITYIKGDKEKGAVIDYKKSTTPTKKEFSKTSESLSSYQLPLYKLLIDHNPSSVIKSVDSASYYNISKEKYLEIWGDGEEELAAHFCTLSKKAINMMVDRIKNGDLGATPSKTSCEHCDYRRLCRRRYFLP